MASYWLSYRIGDLDPTGYHVANIVLHFLTAVLVTLVCARLLLWAGVGRTRRAVAAVVGGALFLLHPLQTESVAYISSRSETLSVALYCAAYVVFLYRPPGPVGLWRGAAIGAFTAVALVTKEHTLTLPLLLVLTDLFWNPKKLRENIGMYSFMLVIGVAGGIYIAWILVNSLSAGFALAGLSPLTYFLTQCRVIWLYIGLFFYPVGQNIDTDFAVSHGLFDHATIFGLIGLLAAVGLAVRFRNRWPLASFGVLAFILLIAPTSSIIPITDVVAERRMYLPFIGLVLVCLEPLRRLAVAHAILLAVPLITISGWLTYQRNSLWGSPVALWADATTKSPRKVRPRFQLGYYYYYVGDCELAAQNFEIAAGLEKPTAALLANWGASLTCARRPKRAVEVLTDAAALTPNFEIVHLYLGDAYSSLGDVANAVEQYKRALSINPSSVPAQEALNKLEIGH
jgi:hypothetical protein